MNELILGTICIVTIVLIVVFYKYILNAVAELAMGEC